MRALKRKFFNDEKLYFELSFDLNTTDPETANKRISVIEATIPWEVLKKANVTYEFSEIIDSDRNRY